MESREDDVLLAERILTGDQGAAETLVLHVKRRLMALAHSMGIRDDAEDLVQEALLASIEWIRRGSYRGTSSLYTATFGILRRKIIDYRRKQARLALGHVEPSGETALENYPGPDDIEREYEIRDTMHQALLRMDDEHRLILLLNQVEELTIKDIAVLLGRSSGRVGALLAEAKRHFRDFVTQGELSRPR